MSDNPITLFEKELSLLIDKNIPFEWASSKNSLAYALLSTAIERYDIKPLRQQIVELQESIQHSDKESALQDWVVLQTDYAAAVHKLGQIESLDIVSKLNDATEAYKNLLPFVTRQEHPQEWALMMHNFARIFQEQGEVSLGTRMLERAISAYSNVLTIRTIKDTPLEWSLTQNNVGVSMQLLGEIKQDVDILKEALNCFENALKNLPQEKNPVGWLFATSNAGFVRMTLAEQTKNAEMAQQAVVDYRAIVDFLSNVSNTQFSNIAEQYRDKAQGIEKEINA